MYPGSGKQCEKYAFTHGLPSFEPQLEIVVFFYVPFLTIRKFVLGTTGLQQVVVHHYRHLRLARMGSIDYVELL